MAEVERRTWKSADGREIAATVAGNRQTVTIVDAPGSYGDETIDSSTLPGDAFLGWLRERVPADVSDDVIAWLEQLTETGP